MRWLPPYDALAIPRQHLRLMPGGTAAAELHGHDDVLMLDT